jgi:outer membrane protein OmpA-like peptidoglycan-associated protein
MTALLVFRLLETFATAHAADADAFLPASSQAIGRGTIVTEAPWLGNEGWTAGFFPTMAHDLAVFRYRDGGETPILEQIFRTDLYGGYTVGDRVRIDGFLPIYFQADAPWAETRGGGLGDMRLQATLPVFERGDDLAVSVVPRLSLPTGKNKAFVGKGMAVGVLGAAGGTFRDFEWVGNAGFTLTPAAEIAGRTLGSTVDAMAGVTYPLEEHLRVGADMHLALGLASKLTGYGNSFANGNLFARIDTESGFGITAGIGTGLIAGVGTPDYRGFAAFTYGRSERDKDRDGIADGADLCPIDPEDNDDFDDTDGCPEADNDQDGLVDGTDKCPVDAEDTDGFADDDGCPELDNDNDTIADAQDQCPLQAGIAALQGCPDGDGDGLSDDKDLCRTEPGPAETGGCPDRDNDRVADSRDRCPDEPGPADEDPRLSDGCPKRVYVAATEVRITEKVFFETNKATIKAQSFELLDTVASTLTQYPWLRRVEVAGHTDDVGDDAKNLKLSDARARAVSDYLRQKGVPEERLSALGYGETKPIDTNKTEEGRSNNRRVEFRILEKGEPSAEAGNQP